MPENQWEIETTLVICSDDPGTTADRIASLRSLGGYRLVPRSPVVLHDRYLDTASGALRPHRIALRIRTVGDKHRITVKGPSIADPDSGAKSRMEVELPWSPDALARVAGILSGFGVPLVGAEREGDPIEVLGGLGLRIVQNRTTHRRRRDFVQEESTVVRAELAVDSVQYHFDGRKVKHHEVEIEAKDQDDPGVIGGMTAHLVSQFPGVLRRWGRGKYSTGRAIERLLLRGELDGLVGSGGNLRPEAYTRIEEG